MTCNFGAIVGGGHTTSAVVSGTVTPHPVAPNGAVSLSGSASIAMPQALVSKLVSGLGATGVTVNAISVGIDATGSVVQSAQTAAVTSISGLPLPTTIPVANLSSPIPGALSTVNFTAGSSAGSIDLSACDTVFAVSIDLPGGSTIVNQGGTCVPDTAQTLASVPVSSIQGTSTSTSSTTTSTMPGTCTSTTTTMSATSSTISPTTATTLVPPVAPDPRLATVASGLDLPSGLATDSAGDVFVANEGPSGSVTVVPAHSGTIFGVAVTAGVPARIVTPGPSAVPPYCQAPGAYSGLTNLTSVAVDSAGNLYLVGDAGPCSVAAFNPNAMALVEISRATGSSTVLYSDQTANACGEFHMDGVAVDRAGNVYFGEIAAAGGGVTYIGVLPKATGTLLGQSVTANVVTTLPYVPGDVTGLAVDSQGNLVMSMEVSAGDQPGGVYVFPQASGTVFGTAVTAGTWSELTPSLSTIMVSGLAFDSAGNLYISEAGDAYVSANPTSPGVDVLASSAEELFGTSVAANTVTPLVSAGLSEPMGLAFGPSGNLYIADQKANTVLELLTPPTVTSVSPKSTTIGGNTVQITGTGFTNVSAVDFGALPSSNIQVVSSSEIKAVVPGPQPPQVMDVTVDAHGETSPLTSADRFTYTGNATTTSTTTTSTTTTSTTSTTVKFNICKYVPFFLRWLFGLILHCTY